MTRSPSAVSLAVLALLAPSCGLFRNTDDARLRELDVGAGVADQGPDSAADDDAGPDAADADTVEYPVLEVQLRQPQCAAPNFSRLSVSPPAAAKLVVGAPPFAVDAADAAIGWVDTVFGSGPQEVGFALLGPDDDVLIRGSTSFVGGEVIGLSISSSLAPNTAEVEATVITPGTAYRCTFGGSATDTQWAGSCVAVDEVVDLVRRSGIADPTQVEVSFGLQDWLLFSYSSVVVVSGSIGANWRMFTFETTSDGVISQLAMPPVLDGATAGLVRLFPGVTRRTRGYPVAVTATVASDGATEVRAHVLAEDRTRYEELSTLPAPPPDAVVQPGRLEPTSVATLAVAGLGTLDPDASRLDLGWVAVREPNRLLFSSEDLNETVTQVALPDVDFIDEIQVATGLYAQPSLFFVRTHSATGDPGLAFATWDFALDVGMISLTPGWTAVGGAAAGAEGDRALLVVSGEPQPGSQGLFAARLNPTTLCPP